MFFYIYAVHVMEWRVRVCVSVCLDGIYVFRSEKPKFSLISIVLNCNYARVPIVMSKLDKRFSHTLAELNVHARIDTVEEWLDVGGKHVSKLLLQ